MCVFEWLCDQCIRFFIKFASEVESRTFKFSHNELVLQNIQNKKKLNKIGKPAENCPPGKNRTKSGDMMEQEKKEKDCTKVVASHDKKVIKSKLSTTIEVEIIEEQKSNNEKR